MGTAVRPSGPSGALHTSGARCAGVWLGASARCPAMPRHRPWVLQSGLAAALHTDGDGGLAALGADCRRVGGVSRF